MDAQVTRDTETINERETLLRLALLRTPGGSPRLLRAALTACGRIENAVAMRDRLPAALRDVLASLPADDAALRALLAAERVFLDGRDARLLWQGEADWPPLLDEIAAPPALLFCRGD